MANVVYLCSTTGKKDKREEKKRFVDNYTILLKGIVGLGMHLEIFQRIFLEIVRMRG